MSGLHIEFHKDIVEGQDSTVETTDGEFRTDQGRWLRSDFTAEHLQFEIDPEGGALRVSICNSRINLSIVIGDDDMRAFQVRQLEAQLAALKGGA